MTDGEAREMARELVRGSIIEDAASQFIAQILKHAHDERVKPLQKQVAALDAKLAKAVEALEALIQQTYDCEKELTEDLHHMDFCGESDPLTKARATLARVKGESK